jgi:MatE
MDLVSELPDDDGFYGYVPNTADVGPMMIVATIAAGAFLVVTLPFAVMLGEKYDELKKRTRASNVLSDSEDKGPEQSKQVVTIDGIGIVPKDTDESSTSSKRSFASAVSGVIKEVIEKSGRPIRGAGHFKNRHRHQAALDRKKYDKSQYSQNFEIKEVWDESSQQRRVVVSPPSPDATEAEHEAIHDQHAPIAQEFNDGEHPMSDFGGDKAPLNSRNVCLTVPGFLDEIAKCFAWDVEMKRLFKLSIPFALQAVSTGVLDTLTVAVVSKLLGTSAVSAFVIVRLLIELPARFVGGFHEAMWTNCSHAIGNGKQRLCGKYTQISTVLYLVSYTPFAVIWAFLLDDTIRWFGFDEEVILMGTQYGYILIVYHFMAGISESVHGLLDVAGCENFSTVVHSAEEVVTFAVILVWALVGKPALYMIGLVQLGMQIAFLILTILIILRKGWFRPYLGGMLSSCAILVRKTKRTYEGRFR